MKNFETLQLAAFKEMKNQIICLADLGKDPRTTDEDRDAAYFSACGFAWGFQRVGLISWNDAQTYIKKFAAAVEGSLEK